MTNLANHAYWNLAGPAHWGLDAAIADHELRLPGVRFLPVDDSAIPVAGLVPVVGTPHDLRQARVLGDLFDELPAGLDHAYEVPEGDEDLVAFDGLRLAAELHHPVSGRTLTVATDQPAVIAYTGNKLGVPFASQAAICLETQHYPDVVNRPGLGSAVLRHGEHYRSTTELTFGTR